MDVFIFRDRHGRVINLLCSDDEGGVVAYHRGDLIGTLQFDTSDGVLVNISVSPSYRKSGIAHTMIARLRRERDRPLGIRHLHSADAAFAGLVRNLTYEGLVETIN